MTKDELTHFITSRITSVNMEIADWGDRDELIENAAGGGNHDDTFGLGESYGYYHGQLSVLEEILSSLEDVPTVEHSTN